MNALLPLICLLVAVTAVPTNPDAADHGPPDLTPRNDPLHDLVNDALKIQDELDELKTKCANAERRLSEDLMTQLKTQKSSGFRSHRRSKREAETNEDVDGGEAADLMERLTLAADGLRAVAALHSAAQKVEIALREFEAAKERLRQVQAAMEAHEERRNN